MMEVEGFSSWFRFLKVCEVLSDGGGADDGCAAAERARVFRFLEMGGGLSGDC